MEEELLKRNTDCVYFLASPLTCKKGSECEYRHSEIARLNPRDCWYWMSGTCLNPSCAFRHPPLDVQTETQTQAQTQTVSESVTVGVGVGVNKTNAPCYFFHNGFCNKGEKCSYMHNVWKPSNIIQAEKKSDTSSIVKKENKTVPENKHNNGSTVPGFDVLVDNNNNNNNVSEGEYEDVNVLYEDNNDKGRSVLDRIVVPRKRNGEDSSLDLRDLLKRRRTVDEYGPGPGPRPRPRAFDRSRLREKGEGDSSEKQDFERPKTLREILEEKKRMGNNEGN